MTKYQVICRDARDDHYVIELTAESVDVSPYGLAFYSGTTLIAAFRNWERFAAAEAVAA